MVAFANRQQHAVSQHRLAHGVQADDEQAQVHPGELFAAAGERA